MKPKVCHGLLLDSSLTPRYKPEKLYGGTPFFKIDLRNGFRRAYVIRFGKLLISKHNR